MTITLSIPGGRLSRIHVNRQTIARNAKHGTSDPAVIIRRGTKRIYAHEVRIDGPSSVVYSPHKPLPCGARLWIETTAPIEATTHDFAP